MERALSPMMTTNLRYFLTEDGAIKPTRGLARRLAEHLTQLVVVASADPGAGPVTAVRCHNKTHQRQCHGEISVAVDARSGNIAWRCPVCRDDGVITNWQGTAWDRRQRPAGS